jgi:hypothetical protein
MSCSRRAYRFLAVCTSTADAVISESDWDEVRTQWLIHAWSSDSIMCARSGCEAIFSCSDTC